MNENISIYPNPTVGSIYIDFENLPANNFVTIKTNLNQEVLSFNNLSQSKIEINMVDFPKGIYFVIINNGISIFNQKIILN